MKALKHEIRFTRLRLFRHQVVAAYDGVEAGVVKSSQSVRWRIDDRFAGQIEGRIEQQRHARQPLKVGDQLMQKRSLWRLGPLGASR